MAQILVDENVPISVMEWLRNRGIIVQRASETGFRGAKDEDIARFAAKNKMIIITLDTDFAHIYYEFFRGSLGVIVVRVKPSTPTNIIEAINATLRKIELNKIQNKLVIITKRRMRIIT